MLPKAYLLPLLLLSTAVLSQKPVKDENQPPVQPPPLIHPDDQLPPKQDKEQLAKLKSVTKIMESDLANAIKNMTNKTISKLEKNFEKQCSSTNPEDFEYSEEDLYEGYKRLNKYMTWARKPVYYGSHFNFIYAWGKGLKLDVLSGYGTLVFWFGIILGVVTVFLLLMNCFFYYSPTNFQDFYDTVTGDSSGMSNMKSENTEYFAYEYYKDMKNWMSRSNISPMSLFTLKFISAGVVIGSLVIAMGQILRLETTGDCGLMKAMIDLNRGKKGDLFYEFGHMGNNSFLNKFLMDLKHFKKDFFHTDYDKLIGKNFDTYGTDVELAMNTFINLTRTGTVTSCETIKKEIHPRAGANLTYQIEREVRYMVKRGQEITDMAKFLRDIQRNKGDKLQKFQKDLHNITRAVHSMTADIYLMTKYGMNFIKKYDKDTFFLAILGIFWMAYAFLQLLPPKSMRMCSMARPFQISVQLMGAAMMFFFAAIMFLDTQKMVQGCLASYNALYDAKSLHEVMPVVDKNWVEHCVDPKSFGDIEGILPSKKKAELLHGFNVLRGLSGNITDFLDDMPKGRLKGVSTMKRSIDAWKTHHHNLLDSKENKKHSYQRAVKKINNYARCTRAQISLTVHHCRGSFSNHQILTSIPDLPEGLQGDRVMALEHALRNRSSLCIVLPQIEPPLTHLELSRFFRNRPCLKKKKKIQKSFFDHSLKTFQQCVDSHQTYMDIMDEHFQIFSKKLKLVSHELRGTNMTYNFLRHDFRESIMAYEKEGADIEDMMNCSIIRTKLRNALGSFCFATKHHSRGGLHRSDASNRKIMWSAWVWYFISAFALILVSLSSFLEGLIDKVVMRKWREVSGKSEEQGRRMDII
jgi:hypothetical protein